MRRDLVIVLTAAALLIAWLGWQARPDDSARTLLQATRLLGDAPENFTQVTEPRPFVFPADHAAHPGYRNEWWYFTGNLQSADKQGNSREFGFQFTLFRFELDPGALPDSDWAASAVWMAHVALSDIDNQKFHQTQRFARDTLGLAGATSSRWWLGDWQVLQDSNDFVLSMKADDFSIQLDLESLRPIVAQGNDGYSRKGPEVGNASYYYSLSRLQARGNVAIGAEKIPVAGLAWLDREWGSSQLAEGLGGWDWFSLQLDDGRDLMVFQLRTDDGQPSQWSAGKIVHPDGYSRTLERNDFSLAPQRRWRDARGHRWPLEWTVDVPEEGLKLKVVPRFDDQRWTGSVSYWEGAVQVLDADSGQTLGHGYLELSGYAD